MINNIFQKIQNNKVPNILLIGDVMLDEQINGTVSKISAEAPIPVVLYKNKKYFAGGAANVAKNLSKMNSNVFLIGVTGGDSAHNILKNILKNTINVNFIIDDERPTTTKTRVTSLGHQIVRIDNESTSNISLELERQVIKTFKNVVGQNQPDVIIMSDYHKGTLTESVCSSVIETANFLKIPVLVDPKGTSYQKYSNCTLITPNKQELYQVIKKTEINELIHDAQEMCKNLNIENIALTRSEEGISFITRDSHMHYKATAQGVVDVCGAGDAVIAATAIGLGLGLSMSESVYLGNLAGIASVKKSGTYAVSRTDLIKECVDNHKGLSINKVFKINEIKETIQSWKKDKESIVFTNGCFDIFHMGHLSLLKACRDMGTKTVVGLNSDNSVQKIKGQGRPIVKENERASFLAALEYVDMVVLFNEETPINLIEAVRPDVLVKGGDYEIEKIVGYDFVTKNNGKVITVDLVNDISTTKIVEKILKKR